MTDPTDPTDPTDTPVDTPGDTVSIHVAAPPERCWDLVADITAMGRLSPECTGGRWLGGAPGPSVGARFVGFNRRGRVRWFTVSTVVECERPDRFAFRTRDSGTTWSYRFEAHDGGTRVTESRAAFRSRPLMATVFSKLLLGGVAGHDDEMRRGMLATLERLKDLAERG